jgi:hypothetical protein
MVSMSSARRRPGIDTDAYLRMTARIVSGAGRRVADADPEDLAALLKLRDAVDQAILQAVAGLRASGCTWQDIGDAIGTTRQAAIMRWARKVEPIRYGAPQRPAEREIRPRA